MSPKADPKSYFEHTGSRYTYKVKLPDKYVIAAEVKAIGDDPLMLHKVRILDPETGAQIGGDLMTDEKGVVRAEVPENKEYRIEIVEEEPEGAPEPVPPEIEPALLRCEFVHLSGEPLAEVEVVATYGDHEIQLVTDARGRIDVPAHLGYYELKVEDETFEAHAIALQDAESEESFYRFVVGTGESAEESEGHDPEERLITHDSPPESVEEYLE